MNKSGKELLGRHLHRFLKRFFEAQDDIDPAAAERIARVLGVTFSSVRLRRQGGAFAGRYLQREEFIASGERQKKTSQPEKAAVQAENDASYPQNCPQVKLAVESDEKFNPYAFGLVPVFVREGPDGLLQRLNTIQRLDHLRTLARFQQIALPSEFRHGDVAVDDVRSAIVTAVGKRIADRRAAAG